MVTVTEPLYSDLSQWRSAATLSMQKITMSDPLSPGGIGDLRRALLPSSDIEGSSSSPLARPAPHGVTKPTKLNLLDEDRWKSVP